MGHHKQCDECDDWFEGRCMAGYLEYCGGRWFKKALVEEDPLPKSNEQDRITKLEEQFKEIRREFGIVMKDLTDTIQQAKDNLEEKAIEIFEKGDFMREAKKFMIALVQQEIKAQIKNADLHAMVGSLVKQKIDNDFKEMTEDVITAIVNGINKKLTKDYEITKELTYSIDAEIRHTLMKMPISAVSEQEVKKRIMGILAGKNIGQIQEKEIAQLPLKTQNEGTGK